MFSNEIAWLLDSKRPDAGRFKAIDRHWRVIAPVLASKEMTTRDIAALLVADKTNTLRLMRELESRGKVASRRINPVRGVAWRIA